MQLIVKRIDWLKRQIKFCVTDFQFDDLVIDSNESRKRGPLGPFFFFQNIFLYLEL